jgi:adenosylcobinamide-phosphate synthase
MGMDSAFLNVTVPLIVGYILDLLFGDPHWFPHPVKGFGWIISKSEQLINKGKARFVKGSILSLLLVIFTFFIVFYLHKTISVLTYYWLWIFDSLVVYFCLANRSLIDEGKAVFKALEESLDAGRERLSWIVGRDTSALSENQVRIAVFETMSENLSDGVIAPLFFYAVGGIPAMVAYKMISTLDSMMGYKNMRYEQFGKFAARCDDVANFIPARITAFLIAVVSLKKRSVQYIFKYGHKHASPNSGYPEAAMAGMLNCTFGGPNLYKGILVNKPYIGEVERAINANEIKKVSCVNHTVTFIFIGLMIVVFTIICKMPVFPEAPLHCYSNYWL